MDAHLRLDSDADGPVVVKSAAPGAVARLRAEADRLGRAVHPGVIAVVAPPDGAPRAPGELRTRYAGEPVAGWAGSLARVAGLGAAVASTLADLHEVGIVHGRLDGSHVLVGDDGRPRLCGFAPVEGATPAGDVAALAEVLADLVARTTAGGGRRGRGGRWGGRAHAWAAGRWPRGPSADRRALAHALDRARDPVPTRRPTARAFADALIAAVPSADLPTPLAPDDPGAAHPTPPHPDPTHGSPTGPATPASRQEPDPPAGGVQRGPGDPHPPHPDPTHGSPTGPATPAPPAPYTPHPTSSPPRNRAAPAADPTTPAGRHEPDPPAGGAQRGPGDPHIGHGSAGANPPTPAGRDTARPPASEAGPGDRPGPNDPDALPHPADDPGAGVSPSGPLPAGDRLPPRGLDAPRTPPAGHPPPAGDQPSGHVPAANVQPWPGAIATPPAGEHAADPIRLPTPSPSGSAGGHGGGDPTPCEMGSPEHPGPTPVSPGLADLPAPGWAIDAEDDVVTREGPLAARWRAATGQDGIDFGPSDRSRRRRRTVVAALAFGVLAVAAACGLTFVAPGRRTASPTAGAGATAGAGRPAERAETRPPPPSCPAPPAEPAADVDGDGCLEHLAVTDGTVTAGPARWTLGVPGDVIVLGDWDCRGGATPALLRPETGDVFVFPSWARPGRPLTITPERRVRGAVGLHAETVGDGCDRLHVDLSTGATTTIEVAP